MSVTTIPSPAPGIFWQRPSPDADPFLAPGQTVSVGQKIGVIEVMKMFVELHSDKEGIFVRYLVDNGENIPMGAGVIEIEESS